MLCKFAYFQLYLTFHTYGQYVLYPWGYARQDAIDKNDLHRMGKIGASAAKRVSGHKYSVGSAAKMLYPAAGTYEFALGTFTTLENQTYAYVYNTGSAL